MTWLRTLCNLSAEKARAEELAADEKKAAETNVDRFFKEERAARSSIIVTERANFQSYIDKKRSGVLYAEGDAERLKRWGHEWEIREVAERERLRNGWGPLDDGVPLPMPEAMDVPDSEDPKRVDDALRHAPLKATTVDKQSTMDGPYHVWHATHFPQEASSSEDEAVEEEAEESEHETDAASVSVDLSEDGDDRTMFDDDALEAALLVEAQIGEQDDLIGKENLSRINVSVEERACFWAIWRLYDSGALRIEWDEEYRWLVRQRAKEAEENDRRARKRERHARAQREEFERIRAEATRKVYQRQNAVVVKKRELRRERVAVENEEVPARKAIEDRAAFRWCEMLARFPYVAPLLIVSEETFARARLVASEQWIRRLIAHLDTVHRSGQRLFGELESAAAEEYQRSINQWVAADAAAAALTAASSSRRTTLTELSVTSGEEDPVDDDDEIPLWRREDSLVSAAAMVFEKLSETHAVYTTKAAMAGPPGRALRRVSAE